MNNACSCECTAGGKSEVRSCFVPSSNKQLHNVVLLDEFVQIKTVLTDVPIVKKVRIRHNFGELNAI